MPKIKMFAAMPRKIGMASQDFHDHWRHPHGTLGRQLPRIRRYVQSHRIDSDLLDASQQRFDGVAEAWFDNAQDLVELGTDPFYVTHIKPDELLFIDMPALRFVFAHEDCESVESSKETPLSAIDSAWCA